MASKDILLPYRCIGQVFGKRAAAYQPVDKSNNLGFVSVPVNNCVLNYSIRPFRLVWSSDHFPSEIVILARTKKRIFAALKDRIEIIDHTGAWRKTVLKGTESRFLLAMGEVLVVVDADQKVQVLDWRSDEVQVEFDLSSGGFETACLIHPDTFFNKVLAAGKDGRVRIININTAKLVHEFPADKTHFNQMITCMEQSPAKNVVSFGLADGRIHLRNIKTGKVLLTFKQDGAVTALSFRTDGYETLASANSDGTIAIWDLKNQKLVGQKPKAHSSTILSAQFLLGSPFFLTGGADNRIVVWFMETDQALPIPRKVVEGHSNTVTAFRFCGPNSLISAGLDGIVRKFNIHRTDLISRLGIAREVKPDELSSDRFVDIRLEPISDLKLELMREHCFDNVACAHRNSPLVSTWSSRRKTKGSHIMCHERFTKNPQYVSGCVTSLDITNDGALAVLGYSTGHVDVYSMQSGKLKFSFGDPSLKTPKDPDAPAHCSTVLSVQIDFNSVDVLTMGADRQLKWWCMDHLKPRFKQSLKLPEPPVIAKFDRESHLIAIGFETGTLRIYDTRIGNVSRVFPNLIEPNVKFTTLEFSHDSFHLLVSSSNSVIQMIDVQSAVLVGAIRTSNPVRQAQFSPNGRFVVTCHENQREIFVWTNRLFFTSFAQSEKLIADQLPVRALNDFGRLRCTYEDDKLFNLDDSDVEDDAEEDDKNLGRVKDVIIDSEDEGQDECMQLDTQQATVHREIKDHDHGLLTLSGEPSHRWASLPHIEKIRQRNTVQDVISKPPDVPFFLESTPNEAEIVVVANDSGDQRRFASAQRSVSILITDWAQTLAQASVNRPADLKQLFQKLINKPTPVIDFEIRNIPPNLISRFSDMITLQLEEKRDADFAQAILNTFLTVHNQHLCGDSKTTMNGDEEDAGEMDDDVPVSMEDLSVKLETISNVQQKYTDELVELFDETFSVLKWIRSAVL